MLIALLADIHANREALTACLADAENAKVDRYVFLGDLVGYGADPEWVVDCVAAMVEAGAVVVRGNHDAAVANPSEGMVAEAQVAINWTRSRLDDRQKMFLANLPLTVEEADRL
ncbi:MAG TPA: metallophosphoesterase family protein, partial [Pseudolabrys sp.]|nr:metallophosphoesterase family protein [Pseudolabrys sp.]